jgi:hypothetical protein
MVSEILDLARLKCAIDFRCMRLKIFSLQNWINWLAAMAALVHSYMPFLACVLVHVSVKKRLILM